MTQCCFFLTFPNPLLVDNVTRRRAYFGQSEKVASFFIGLFCEEMDVFWRPQPLKQPKKQKGSFFEENIPLK